MKAFVTVAVFLVAFAAVVRSEDAAPAAEANLQDSIVKIYKRLIPADVLRGKYKLAVDCYCKNVTNPINLKYY